MLRHEGTETISVEIMKRIQGGGAIPRHNPQRLAQLLNTLEAPYPRGLCQFFCGCFINT